MSDEFPPFEEVAAQWRPDLKSPIETALWDALIPMIEEEFNDVFDFAFGQEELDAAHDRGFGFQNPEYLMVIAPEYRCGSYRIDIAILVKTGRTEHDADELLLALECDGHEFHDRTKEQARRDRARDRELARGGWVVQRFTGSEIYRDAAACAEEVRSIIMEWGVRSVLRDAVRTRLAGRVLASALAESGHDRDQPWLD